MGELKAIETRYKGYRFRSRLEARWAVFFDTLGIEWEYEKEGYDLGEAGWYLPDFWLPELITWLEVKGDPGEWEEALRKGNALQTKTWQSVVVAVGMPGSHFMHAYFEEYGGDGGGVADCDEVRFCLCPKCGPWIDYYFGRPGRYEAFSHGEPVPGCTCPPMQWDSKTERKADPDGCRAWCMVCNLYTREAEDAAKAARFEHGEAG